MLFSKQHSNIIMWIVYGMIIRPEREFTANDLTRILVRKGQNHSVGVVKQYLIYLTEIKVVAAFEFGPTKMPQYYTLNKDGMAHFQNARNHDRLPW
jgi:hypothetical protein